MLRKFTTHIPIPQGVGDEPPTEILLLKKGKTETENGPYIFNETSAKLLTEEFQRRGVRAFSDWHHSSTLPPEKVLDPRKASAASSHYDLEVRNGDLWATNIEWTPDGYDDLKMKRVTYISPAFDATTKGVVASWRSFALTNDPATHEIAPLVAAEANHDTEEEDSSMTPEETKVLEETKKALEAATKAHEETSKRMEKLEEAHKKLVSKMKERASEEDEEEEDEEEDPKDHPEPDGDEGEDGEDEPEEEDEEKNSRKFTNKRSETSALINKLTLENAKLRGSVTTKGELKARVMAAHRKGLVPKATIPFYLANAKSFNKMMSMAKASGLVSVQQPQADGVTSIEQGTQVVTRTNTKKFNESETKLCRQLGITPEELAAQSK